MSHNLKQEVLPTILAARERLRMTGLRVPESQEIITRDMPDQFGNVGTEFFHLPHSHAWILYQGSYLIPCGPCNAARDLLPADVLALRAVLKRGYPWLNRVQSYSTTTIRVYAGDLDVEIMESNGSGRHHKLHPNHAPLVIPSCTMFSIASTAEATEITAVFGPSLETARRIDEEQENRRTGP